MSTILTEQTYQKQGSNGQIQDGVANEIGVPLTNGYNGNLTAQNGSVGGYMVKKMIESYERQLAGNKSSDTES